MFLCIFMSVRSGLGLGQVRVTARVTARVWVMFGVGVTICIFMIRSREGWMFLCIIIKVGAGLVLGRGYSWVRSL